MSVTITSPAPNLNTTTSVGSVQLEFKDSVATVDEISDGVRAYLLSQGYKVDDVQGVVVESFDGKPLDPVGDVDARDHDQPTQVGTKLRDAAVDPRPEDFLPPTNAGQADPHGPEVVSPEVHASQGTRPVAPGDVAVEDPDAQEAKELAHTESSTDGTPIEPAHEPVELKGEALDDALKAADLPRTGTADEKRARLAEHQAKA